MSADLHWFSVAEAAQLIAARKLSPVEFTEASLRRIEQLEGRLNAFITVDGDAAMAAARTAANELAKSDAHAPLHGVPIALKDIFGVAGVRMTAGSKILSENVASDDAEATARLKAAGAVVLGKLNLHEFAFGATGVNPHYGAARNPWDLERITGGSSSGSGASVAAGECAAALGTDTGGSIRIPASHRRTQAVLLPERRPRGRKRRAVRHWLARRHGSHPDRSRHPADKRDPRRRDSNYAARSLGVPPEVDERTAGRLRRRCTLPPRA